MGSVHSPSTSCASRIVASRVWGKKSVASGEVRGLSIWREGDPILLGLARDHIFPKDRSLQRHLGRNLVVSDGPGIASEAEAVAATGTEAEGSTGGAWIGNEQPTRRIRVPAAESFRCRASRFPLWCSASVDSGARHAAYVRAWRSRVQRGGDMPKPRTWRPGLRRRMTWAVELVTACGEPPRCDSRGN